MPRRRKKRTGGRSQFPSGDRNKFDELMDKAYAYMEHQQPEKALEILEKVPVNFRHHAECLLVKGSAQNLLGMFETAVNDLEKAIRKDPDLISAYLNLAVSYVGLEYSCLAKWAAERYLKKKPSYPEGEYMAREIIAHAQEELSAKAKRVGIGLKTFEQACLPKERAQLGIVKGDFKEALSESDKAIRLAPSWASPHNNRALALFYQGKLQEAIEEEEKVLQTIDADNVHALGNLILFHFCLFRREETRPLAERLRKIALSPSFEDIDLTKVIEALGVWQDDETLWEIARRVKNEPAEVPSTNGWYILGAAAAHISHLR